MSLVDELNAVLHRWTYRRLWEWAVLEDVAGALSVVFSFPADDANRQTAHLRPKEMHWSRFDDPFDAAPRVSEELVHDALPGHHRLPVTRELAAEMVKEPKLARDWLMTTLRKMEDHEFREFFRDAKTRKPVLDPHPKTVKATSDGKNWIVEREDRPSGLFQ